MFGELSSSVLGSRFQAEIEATRASLRESLSLASYDVDLRLASSVLEQVRDIASAFQYDDLRFYSDGSVEIDGEETSFNEIKEALADFIRSINLNLPQGTKEFLRKKFAPTVVAVVSFIILNSLNSVLADIYKIYSQPYVTKFLTSQKQRQIVKHICETISKQIDTTLFPDCRIVVRIELDVKQARTMRSPTIGKLELGQLVRVVKKGRHWSLIEYSLNDFGETQRGWVLTRYLKKIEGSEARRDERDFSEEDWGL